MFRGGFLADVNLQGSGIDINGTAIVREEYCTRARQVRRFPIPAACEPFCSTRGFNRQVCKRYRSPAQIRTTCGVQPVVGTTAAVKPQVLESSLPCGTRIFINDPNLGCRTVQDTGEGPPRQPARLTWIDIYNGAGAAVCRNQPWATTERKVVKINQR